MCDRWRRRPSLHRFDDSHWFSASHQGGRLAMPAIACFASDDSVQSLYLSQGYLVNLLLFSAMRTLHAIQPHAALSWLERSARYSYSYRAAPDNLGDDVVLYYTACVISRGFWFSAVGETRVFRGFHARILAICRSESFPFSCALAITSSADIRPDDITFRHCGRFASN